MRLLVEHYARMGKSELAEQLARRSGVERLVDLNFFLLKYKVLEDLQGKDVSSALEWCDLHKSKLRKLKSPLEFQLKLQKFIELVKERDIVGSINFMRTHASIEHQQEMQQAMTLLVVAHNIEDFPQYAWMLEDSRWE